jgi:hypothetical protein
LLQSVSDKNSAKDLNLVVTLVLMLEIELSEFLTKATRGIIASLQ